MERPPVFLFGATRSGTSWLQKMLGEHPEIATPQELDLFSDYLAPLEASWRRQLPDDETWRAHRYKGLPAVLREEEFGELVRDLVESIHRRVLELKPGAAVVLEKVPDYGAHSELILRHFPDARMIHLVRDGRDVAASLLRASSGWGRGWAASSAAQAAWYWRWYVESGRQALARSRHGLELRYEGLLGPDGPALLHEALEFCGAETTPEEAERIWRRYASAGESGTGSIVWGGEVLARVGPAPTEPEGFYGEGKAGGWRESLGAFDRWAFAREAGTLLRELGYEQDARWVHPGPWRALGPLRRLLSVAGGRVRFAVGAARGTLRAQPSAWLVR